jgi:hypothetical protein
VRLSIEPLVKVDPSLNDGRRLARRCVAVRRRACYAAGAAEAASVASAAAAWAALAAA